MARAPARITSALVRAALVRQRPQETATSGYGEWWFHDEASCVLNVDAARVEIRAAWREYNGDRFAGACGKFAGFGGDKRMRFG